MQIVPNSLSSPVLSFRAIVPLLGVSLLIPVGGALAQNRTTAETGPILTVRIRTGKPPVNQAALNLAPGVELPPALANLSKAPKLFSVALETAQGAPPEATATLTTPEGLKRPNPGTLVINAPREPRMGFARPLSVRLYWGSGTTIPQGQPGEGELAAINFGYYSRGVKPPEKFPGAASVAVGPRVAAPAPDAAPEVRPDISAIGQYSLQTSYAGNAQFSVSPEQDFLEPMRVEAPAEKPDLSQALTLHWSPVARAVGYRLRAMGTRSKGEGKGTEGVIWTSSTVPLQSADDDQSFDEPTQAVKAGVLLPANATSCTIPAGVLTGLTSVAIFAEAYGPGSFKPGNPAVRIQVSSENSFSIPPAGTEPEAGSRPRPTARPRVPEVPSLFKGQPQLYMRFYAYAPSIVRFGEKVSAEGTPRFAAYRSFGTNFAAETPAQEGLTATLGVPPGLVGEANTTLPMNIRVLGRRETSQPREVDVYWGSADAVPQGQPVTQLMSYDEQSSLERGTSRESWTGAGSLASVAASQGSNASRPGPNARVEGKYTLQSSYAGNVEFEVAPSQNYLAVPRIWVTSPSNDFAGALTINWHPVAGALGYRVSVVGTRNQNTREARPVVWSSVRNSPTDARLLYAPLQDVAAALAAGEVLSPETKSVTVPAGILQGAKEVRIAVEAVGPVQVIPAGAGSPAVHVYTSAANTSGLSLPPVQPEAAG